MIKSLNSFRTNTLLVATTVDPASLNIATSLINRQNLWKELSLGKVWVSNYSDMNNNVFLWLQDRPLLHMNYVDKLFKEEVCFPEERLDDVIFLSKHAAASGIPSLTVHPIGIPWTTDTIRNGGLAGRCSPPSYHIGSLFRSLSRKVEAMELQKTYQVSIYIYFLNILMHLKRPLHSFEHIITYHIFIDNTRGYPSRPIL